MKHRFLFPFLLAFGGLLTGAILLDLNTAMAGSGECNRGKWFKTSLTIRDQIDPLSIDASVDLYFQHEVPVKVELYSTNSKLCTTKIGDGDAAYSSPTRAIYSGSVSKDKLGIRGEEVAIYVVFRFESMLEGTKQTCTAIVVL
jgi:hypothetical protein